VLCEIATSRFRFFEDVDLLLPVELKGDLSGLQATWVDHLLRHRAAVLGAVWRSDDPLGVKCKSETATVHVFSSSGWSSSMNFYNFYRVCSILPYRARKGSRLKSSCSISLFDLIYSLQDTISQKYPCISSGQTSL